jgi:hypothetical protein
MFKIIFLSSISRITVKQDRVEKKLRKIKNISVCEKIYLTQNDIRLVSISFNCERNISWTDGHNSSTYIASRILIFLVCLTPLSAIFQLYHGDQF